MNEYKIVFIVLFLYGCYNLNYFYNQNILNKLNVSFYLVVICFAIYGFFYIGSDSNIQSTRSQKQSNNIQNNQKNKINNLQNEVKIIKISQDKYETILKKLQFDDQVLQNSKFSLESIYKVKNKAIKKRFLEYQKNKTEKVKLFGQCGPAYTNFGYHGTKKTCVGFEKICTIKDDCPFCSILTFGFRNAFSGKSMSLILRYGKGTYFSPKLQKALNYCQSDQKIILACKIVMGRVFKPSCIDDYFMQFDGSKYDCIDADPQYTIDIRDPEICIKNEKACLPKYILVFK
ncbi:poly(ADP-ribose) polymerase domain protein (macronuclear) [Tetrahymena thermophila SB210]|uniref:Poly(ADP-ribose) polymerase domain protein n=1 Tax=Tetrahymena thermophila (strain SB210) TaxID=312017 RepID=I7MDL2_TETTS|nr:poly(ADP-ribose) polymerase domain protein [Tetrahymena thermophila SB210]EAR89338.2 poly(ADP-ribose) polymerase domain protein [Tetrahymena thermophila SB210]|eukprot:XP_001009583.2 poly(ADP-ribose) polymerase domain protein [Tetrahymena thermophila SB210]